VLDVSATTVSLFLWDVCFSCFNVKKTMFLHFDLNRNGIPIFQYVTL
jgi:hypothetical protein